MLQKLIFILPSFRHMIGSDDAFMQVAFVATDVVTGQVFWAWRLAKRNNQRSAAPLHFLNSYFLARCDISN
jgi:hypothetical protein